MAPGAQAAHIASISRTSPQPRLNNDRGTHPVAASISTPATLPLSRTPLRPYLRIITSLTEPNAISREAANSDERYKFDTYTQYVLKGDQSTKQYEDETKRRFIEEPANLKLLIVVSKLLTGFDAPSCTYIYLDNELRDHNLFRPSAAHRLTGGRSAIRDFGTFGDVSGHRGLHSATDIDEGSEAENNVHLRNWLDEGRTRLDEAREALRYLCEPVALPREVEQYLHYFCGLAGNPEALNETEPLRVSFYKAVASFVRAFAAIAQNLPDAGYPDADAAALQREVELYAEIRAAIKRHAGEELDPALRGGHAPSPLSGRAADPREPGTIMRWSSCHRNRHPRRHCPQAHARASCRTRDSEGISPPRRSSATAHRSALLRARRLGCSTIDPRAARMRKPR